MVHFYPNRAVFRQTIVLVVLAVMLAVCWAPYVHAAEPLKVAAGSNPALYNTSVRLELKPNPTQYDYALLKIEGGKKPYSVSMSNPILEVRQIGQGSYREYDWVDYRLYPRRAGTAVVTIKDSTGQMLTRQITVYDPSTLPLRLSALPGASDAVAVGQGRNFQVSGGKAPYQVVSANPGIVRIEQHSAVGTYSVWGVADGTTKITVTDANGARVEGIAHVSTTKPLSFRVSDTMLQEGGNEIIIDSGNPPYIFHVTPQLNATITPAGTDNHDRPVYRMVAKSPGKGMVTVRDAKGQFQNRSVTVLEWVTLSFPKLTGSQPILYIGETTNLLIKGGQAPYSVNADKPAAVTIREQGSGQYAVTANQAGVVAFTAKDKTGATRSKTLTIRELTTLSLLMIETTLPVGTTGDLLISGGLAPHSVSVSGNQVSLTKVAENRYTITAKLSGQVTITVKDSKGQTKQVVVTVPQQQQPTQQQPLKATLNPPLLSPATTGDLQISGGLPPYSVSAQGNQVSLTKVAENRYTVTPKLPGSTQIAVKDSGGKVLSVVVGVIVKPLKVTMAPTALRLGTTGDLQISDGVAPYSVTASGNQVSLTKMAENRYIVTPQTAGTTTIIVKDSQGQTKPVVVSVTRPPVSIEMETGPMTVGAARMMDVKGGAPPYSLVYPTSLLKAELKQQTAAYSRYEIIGLIPGNTSLNVRDSLGKTAVAGISIHADLTKPAAPLQVTLSPVKLALAGYNQKQVTGQLSIQGGYPPYTISSQDLVRVSRISADKYEYNVIPQKAGTGTIFVTDSNKTRQGVAFTVAAAPKPPSLQVTASLTRLTLPADGKQPIAGTLTISSGAAPYTVTTSSNKIGIKQVSPTQYEMIPIAKGSAIITVIDSFKQKKTLTYVIN